MAIDLHVKLSGDRSGVGSTIRIFKRKWFRTVTSEYVCVVSESDDCHPEHTVWQLVPDAMSQMDNRHWLHMVDNDMHVLLCKRLQRELALVNFHNASGNYFDWYS